MFFNVLCVCVCVHAYVCEIVRQIVKSLPKKVKMINDKRS